MRTKDDFARQVGPIYWEGSRSIVCFLKEEADLVVRIGKQRLPSCLA